MPHDRAVLNASARICQASASSLFRVAFCAACGRELSPEELLIGRCRGCLEPITHVVVSRSMRSGSSYSKCRCFYGSLGV